MLKTHLLSLIASCVLALSSTVMMAAEANLVSVSPEQAKMNTVKATIEKKLAGFKVDHIQQSPIPSLFELSSRGDIYYATKDGNMIFTGRLIGLENGIVDLTRAAKMRESAKLSPKRKKILDGIADNQTFLFKAPNEKHRINVFVDVSCGYCRKLHKEIPQLNQMGVTVRYLAYPRRGLQSNDAQKMVSAWCADDRDKAIGLAFHDQPIPEKTCKNPVAEQYSLVPVFGVNGTPNIIFANGDLWPGYLKASDIIAQIKKRGL